MTRFVCTIVALLVTACASQPPAPTPTAPAASPATHVATVAPPPELPAPPQFAPLPPPLPLPADEHDEASRKNVRKSKGKQGAQVGWPEMPEDYLARTRDAPPVGPCDAPSCLVIRDRAAVPSLLAALLADVDFTRDMVVYIVHDPPGSQGERIRGYAGTTQPALGGSAVVVEVPLVACPYCGGPARPPEPSQHVVIRVTRSDATVRVRSRDWCPYCDPRQP